MGIAVDVVEFTLNTSTGTQNITGSLGGLTPKAALFFVTRATANGSAAAHAAMSIGAATGVSNEWAFSNNSEDGQATTDTFDQNASTRCILLTDPGVSTVDMDAEFSAFITNGVRINITTASSAYKGICILFAGSDLSAHANNVADIGDATDTESNVTAPGFEPDLVFTCMGSSSMGGGGSDFEVSFGITHNGDTITERCLVYRSEDNEASGDPKFWLNTGYSGGKIFGGGTVDWNLELDNFDSSGFSMFTRTGGGNNVAIGYLALAFAGAVGISLYTEATPTSTGNLSSTNPGFTPQAVFGIQTYGQSVDTEIDGTGDAGAWGISAFTASTEMCSAVADEDAAATTNTQSYTNTKAIDVPNDDGTTALTAVFVSMDANGYTRNWTNVEAAARQGFFLAIEAEAGVLYPNVVLYPSALELFWASPAISFQLSTTLYGESTSFGNIIREPQKVLLGTSTSSGEIIKDAYSLLEGTSTSSGGLTKFLQKAFSGASTSVGSLTKKVLRALEGASTSVGSLIKKAIKLLSGASTSLGDLDVSSVRILEEPPDTEKLTYIEKIIFTAPYTIRVIGGTDKRLETFLAQKGVVTQSEALRSDYYPTDRDIVLGPDQNITRSDGGGGGGGGGQNCCPSVYPMDEEGALVSIGGVIFWPSSAGTIPLGWIVFSALAGRVPFGAGGTFALGSTGGAETYDLSHVHGPGNLGTDSDNHSHGPGTLNTDSDGHTHGPDTLDTDNDTHTHTSTLNVTGATSGSDFNAMQGITIDNDTHDHAVDAGLTDSDSHSHDLDAGTSASDSHSHTVDSGQTGTEGSTVQSTLPPYLVGTWIQFVGSNPS